MLYRLIRPVLFAQTPADAHRSAIRALRVLAPFRSDARFEPTRASEREVMGLRFPNPIGLAAGFDKSGLYIDDMAALGFGFIEVGSVTPRPQPGNPPPNLFRLVEDDALINRMGFNNDGVEATVRRLEKRRYKGICGVNIGKNFDTPLENASSDYLKCLRAVYATADYITVNISSPNTPGLRDLQHESSLEKLLADVVNERELLRGTHSKRVPLVVKIAPDLDEAGIDSICRVLEKSGFDGVCATNTTITRPETLRSKHAPEKGGLSGRPVHELSKRVIRALRSRLGPDFPIIGVGGIESTDTGRATFAAGADLIQVYSGLIYQGPSLVTQLIEASNDRRAGGVRSRKLP